MERDDACHVFFSSSYRCFVAFHFFSIFVLAGVQSTQWVQCALCFPLVCVAEVIGSRFKCLPPDTCKPMINVWATGSLSGD